MRPLSNRVLLTKNATTVLIVRLDFGCWRMAQRLKTRLTTKNIRDLILVSLSHTFVARDGIHCYRREWSVAVNKTDVVGYVRRTLITMETVISLQTS